MWYQPGAQEPDGVRIAEAGHRGRTGKVVVFNLQMAFICFAGAGKEVEQPQRVAFVRARFGRYEDSRVGRKLIQTRQAWQSVHDPMEIRTVVSSDETGPISGESSWRRQCKISVARVILITVLIPQRLDSDTLIQ